MEIRELKTLEEMIPHLNILREMYPELELENYRSMLEKMIPNNYAQVGVFCNNECIAISGYWLGTKLWCGPYLELDNVIATPIAPAARSNRPRRPGCAYRCADDATA